MRTDKFDPNGKIADKTRGGVRVRNFRWTGDWIHGEMEVSSADWCPCKWKADGRGYHTVDRDSDCDLMNVVPAPVDWTQPIQHRDGRAARYIGYVASTGRNQLVAVMGVNGVESVYHCYETGDIQHGKPAIINVPAPAPEPLVFEYAWAEHTYQGKAVAVKAPNGEIAIQPIAGISSTHRQQSMAESTGWKFFGWQSLSISKES